MTCGNCGGGCGSVKRTKLCIISFALAWGIAFGLLMLFIGWYGWLSGRHFEIIRMIETFYYGFAPTFVGGLFGGFWGFIEGFILGLLIALFYNLISCCCHMSCCKSAGCKCGTDGSGHCKCQCAGCASEPTIKKTDQVGNRL